MIKTPSLILHTDIAHQNIDKMMALCQKWNMDFRPHFKTHQSAEIGEWFRKKGIGKCTVSSLSMAAYFASHGWKDITIAIPVNVLEIDEINRLARQVKLNLLIDHKETCLFLSEHLKSNVSVFIEIDTAYGRSGVYYQNTKGIDDLLRTIKASPLMKSKGFLSHTGNSYSAENMVKGAEIFELSRQRMLKLKQSYLKACPNLIISMGDTPSSTFANDFNEIDEWRPGNFVFYDMMQFANGVCQVEEIALIVRCPVIGIYPKRKEIVIYGGGVHLSKESMMFQGERIFGWVQAENEVGQENMFSGFPLISLSQEHGIIAVSEEFLSQIKIGDLVDIIPVHSCMAADLYAAYFTEDGEVVGKFRLG